MNSVVLSLLDECLYFFENSFFTSYVYIVKIIHNRTQEAYRKERHSVKFLQ